MHEVGLAIVKQALKACRTFKFKGSSGALRLYALRNIALQLLYYIISPSKIVLRLFVMLGSRQQASFATWFRGQKEFRRPQTYCLTFSRGNVKKAKNCTETRRIMHYVMTRFQTVVSHNPSQETGSFRAGAVCCRPRHAHSLLNSSSSDITMMC